MELDLRRLFTSGYLLPRKTKGSQGRPIITQHGAEGMIRIVVTDTSSTALNIHVSL